MDEFRDYEYEEEIDLKQLLVYVLRRWRTMIAAAVVLGLLLGGAKIAKGFLDLQDPEKVAESIREAELAQQNYDTAKAQLTNQMAEYNRQIEDYQKYQENSLYMRIDPYAVYKESITYVVTTDYQILPNMTYQTLNWMGPVLSAYTTVANSVTLKDLPPEGRAGLSEEWDADSLEKLVEIETDADDGNLTIIVSAESETRAKAILKAVQKKVEESQKSVAEAAGEHKLTLISEKSTITVDQAFITDRENRLKNVTALREAADKAVEKYNKLRIPKDTALSLKNSLKEGIKFGILGAIAGIIFVCGWFGVGYFMDGKLNDVSSLKERYRARVLAILPEGHKKSGVIDNLLDKLEGYGGSWQNAEPLLYVAGASLGKIKENTTIAVAGTAPAKEVEEVSEILKQHADGLAIKNIGNILEDAVAVRQAKISDSVLLVEKRHVSRTEDLERETELLHGMGVRLEGFIIV